MRFLAKLIIPLLFVSSLMASDELDINKSAIVDMLSAIQNNDCATFVKNGSDLFKQAITPEIVAQIHSSVDLSQYELEYFGAINRGEYKQTCWKLVCADSREWLLSFSVNEDTVLGFYIN